MAGYSGTALPKKLGVKEGARLMLLHAPDGFGETLGELPAGVTVVRRLSGTADVVVAFIDRRAHLDAAPKPLVAQHSSSSAPRRLTRGQAR